MLKITRKSCKNVLPAGLKKLEKRNQLLRMKLAFFTRAFAGRTVLQSDLHRENTELAKRLDELCVKYETNSAIMHILANGGYKPGPDDALFL